mgnify:CR=1 FL=1
MTTRRPDIADEDLAPEPELEAAVDEPARDEPAPAADRLCARLDAATGDLLLYHERRAAGYSTTEPTEDVVLRVAPKDQKAIAIALGMA